MIAHEPTHDLIRVNKHWIKGLLLAFLAAIELLLGALIGIRPERAYLTLGGTIGLVVVVATLLKPAIGLYVFVATTFTEALFMLGSVSAARLVGILAFGAWIAHSLATGRFKIIVPRSGWAAILFVAWGLVSAIWALDLQKLFTAWVILVQSMALYILVINIVNSARQVRITLALIVVVSLGLALLTLSRVFMQELVAGRADLGQISVTDVNAQAAYFFPSVMLLAVLFCHETRLAPRLFFLLLGLSAVLLAILATSSRGAMVSLVVILILGVLLERRMLRIALPALLAAAGAILYLPPLLLERIKSIVTLSDRGAGRLDIWSVAWQIIANHPVLGIGLDSFGRAFDIYVSETPGVVSYIGRGRGSHNILLNVQGELGVIGLALFVTFVAMTVQSGLVAIANLKRAGDSRMAILALAIWLSMVGILVMGLFIDLQYWKLFWLSMALPEVMQRLSVNALQERASG